jgi:methylmalonyl-CoA mutase N-terminal domain/subunit
LTRRSGSRRRAAKIALRTQQIVGFESGIADTVDPLAGSYFVESLTDEVEQAACLPGAH